VRIEATSSPKINRLDMTYCCGILVREGLVMIADTRTNAGLDNISVFRKLNVYEKPGELIMALASSGNLSFSQSANRRGRDADQRPEYVSGSAKDRACDPRDFRSGR
jgi:hypothetical protein